MLCVKFHHILFLLRLIPPPILRLKHHCPLFMHLQRMPLASLNLHNRMFPTRLHHKLIRDIALIIIMPHNHLPPNHTDSLRCLPVPVNRHHCPRLQRVEHPLAVILLTVPQVIVLPKSRGGLGMGGESGENVLGDIHTQLVL